MPTSTSLRCNRKLRSRRPLVHRRLRLRVRRQVRRRVAEWLWLPPAILYRRRGCGGMSAAVITGHCYRNYWAQIGDNMPIAEDAIVMFGVRDVSPQAERERLQRSAI